MADSMHDMGLYRDVAQLRDAMATLQSGGGGGTSDRMEARVSVLEANVGHINDNLTEIRKDVRELRNDAKVEFRLLFGAIITVALGLAALMAHGFKWF